MAADVLAAWVQAVGSVAAILLAIALPRLDRRRARSEYGEAAMAAVANAHQQILAIWSILNGHSPIPADPRDFIGELERPGREIDAFPLLGAASVEAVGRMRQLARCAEGVAEAVKAGGPEAVQRVNDIENYAYHLRVLIARDLGKAEPPPPTRTGGCQTM